MNPFAYIPEVGDTQKDILKALAHCHICHSLKPSLCPPLLHENHCFFSPSKSVSSPPLGSKGKEVDKHSLERFYMWISICLKITVNLNMPYYRYFSKKQSFAPWSTTFKRIQQENRIDSKKHTLIQIQFWLSQWLLCSWYWAAIQSSAPAGIAVETQCTPGPSCWSLLKGGFFGSIAAGLHFYREIVRRSALS